MNIAAKVRNVNTIEVQSSGCTFASITQSSGASFSLKDSTVGVSSFTAGQGSLVYGYPFSFVLITSFLLFYSF